MAVNYFNFILAQQEEAHERKITRRMIRDSHNPFEMPATEFQKVFRLTKEMVLFLCEELRVELQPINEEDGLPIHIKVLTSVRLLGDGSYQRPTGQDHTVCIAQTTVSKYLAQFTEAVNRVLLPKWVYFPATEAERQALSRGFQEKFGVPDAIGAVDCTHVAIFPPPGPQRVQYRNRKGYHSINTQLVCDADCRILHANARYPGRVHDQFIFNHSNLRREMSRLYEARIGSYYLLGDSGYALEPWVMTPIVDAPENSPADLYTQWHCKARNCIERTNGYLKGTFRCLGHDRVLHYSPEKASAIIYTCITLYNIMKHYRVPFGNHDDEVNENEEGNAEPVRPAGALLRAGQQRRLQLINNFFTYIASSFCPYLKYVARIGISLDCVIKSLERIINIIKVYVHVPIVCKIFK